MSKNKVAVATPGFYSLHIPFKKKIFKTGTKNHPDNLTFANNTFTLM